MKVKDHWDNVAGLRCCISTSPSPTIHHCHGGSMIEWFGEAYGTRGKGMKTSDFLVIPLAAQYHTGEYGIDQGMSVPTWERVFGSQVYYLHWVNHQLPYDIFELAGVPSPQAPDSWMIATPAGQPITGGFTC